MSGISTSQIQKPRICPTQTSLPKTGRREKGAGKQEMVQNIRPKTTGVVTPKNQAHSKLPWSSTKPTLSLLLLGRGTLGSRRLGPLLSSRLPYALGHRYRLGLPLVFVALIVAVTYDGDGLTRWWRRGRGRQGFADWGGHDSLGLLNFDGDKDLFLGGNFNHVRATRTTRTSSGALDTLRSGWGCASTGWHGNSDGLDRRDEGRSDGGRRDDGLDGKRGLGSGSDGCRDVVNHRSSSFVND
ncbi:hypothetical protein BDV93DRAFT_282124 [Ceratobasidium sp. AG-I]|nr:hypothetical protein BDV93DRAFT_282124 [Ceratobasidium sp. AG-I]